MPQMLWTALMTLAPCAVLAQGGPPMVTDDPDTPGNGRWEINLAAIGNHTPGLAALTVPDADINYGWGDHVQLKLDTAWLVADEAGRGLISGAGAPDLGVKWRFLDQERAGFAVSTYPQYIVNYAASSSTRGLTEPGRQFFLPIEASTRIGAWGLDGEVGRNFASEIPGSWAAGFILARELAPGLVWMAEVRESLAPHDIQTLVNLGAHLQLNGRLNLIGALGRDIGPHTYDREDILFYLGLQLEL
jgi:hypothetical protein